MYSAIGRLISAGAATGMLSAIPLHALAWSPNQEAAYNSFYNYSYVPPSYFDPSQSIPISSLLADVPERLQPMIISQLSGDAHASFSSSLTLGDIDQSNQNLGNLRNSLDTGGGPAMWVSFGRGRERISGDGNGPGVRADTSQGMFGGDLPLGDSPWRLGGAFGKGTRKLNNTDREASAESDSDSYSLYGGRDLKLPGSALRFSAGATYSEHRISSKRHISIPFDPEINRARYTISTQQTFAETAFNLPTGRPGYLEPFFGLNYIQQDSEGFRERGINAAALVQGQSNQLLVSDFGSRGKQEYTVAGRKLVLKGHLVWRRLNGDLRPEVELQLPGTPRFTVQGVQLPRNSYLVEIKADYFLTPLVVLDLDYNGSFGDGREGHRIALNAHLKL
jgi:subtilase-type serine protease